jgi:RsiW-degrading membrane proteinase PrsW (M82 family)
MNLFSVILGSCLIILSVLMCYQESKRKPISFLVAILLCFIITPIGVYLLYRFLPNKNPIGCMHCGNSKNEAEYCGICGKNILGDFHPTWNKK